MTSSSTSTSRSSSPGLTSPKLGEYYTPDWLADRVVAATVTDPLNQRVLDPSCGSGTFVFHAVRAYLSAAEAAGIGLREAVAGVVTHVLGMDIHPVAVTLARVTYLLAIGTDRLNAAGPTRDLDPGLPRRLPPVGTEPRPVHSR